MKTVDEVREQFMDEIVRPPMRPKQQSLLCPVGLVGAGKTTVVRPISEALGFTRVSSDELRKLLKENGHTYEPVKQLLISVGNELLQAGDSLTLDLDCGNPEIISYVDQVAKKYGLRVFWLHINTPKEYIFEKFRKHPPSWLADNPEQMIENYEQQVALRKTQMFSMQFDWVFDTSLPTVQQEIEACTEYVRCRVE